MFKNINIIEIAQWALLLILGLGAAYYRTNAKLQKYVANLISQAEATYTESKSGGVKFCWVCDKIYSMIPAPLKLIITRQIVETIVQGAFNAMAQYAKFQIDKLVNAAIPETVHTEDK